MNNKRIVTKSLMYLIGNLSSKILVTILVPIYAFYVQSEDFGNYDLAQTLMNIIIPIVFMAIWEAILKFTLSSKKEQNTKHIINTSLIFVIGVSTLYCIVATAISIFVDIKPLEYTLMIIMILSHGLTQIWQYYCRALQNNKLYVIAGILGTVFNFISTIILVCGLYLGIIGLYISYIIGQITIIFIIEIKLHVGHYLDFKKFDGCTLIEMLKFSSPLVLNTISMWLIPLLMRLIVKNHLGISSTGLYAFANKFNLIVNLIGTVVTMAVIEEAILSAAEEGAIDKFKDTIQQLFRIFQTLIIIAIPAVYIFYRFIKNTEYFVTVHYIAWFLAYATAMTLSSNVGSIFQVIEKTQYQFVTTLLGGGAGVIVSLLLVNKIGMTAVLFGQFVGAITILLMRYFVAWKIVKFNIKWMPVLMDLVVFILISEVCSRGNMILYCMCFSVVCIYAFLRNRSLVVNMINSIKDKRRLHK